MRTAWSITDVGLDAREYIIRLDTPWPAGASTQVSGVFVYLLNMLTKSAIAQMSAASRQTAFNAVDYYGVILSWIASNSDFRLHGNSFADVIIAKFHHSCPPLFGIFGPENTTAGRQRLGWKPELNAQEHFDQVNTLAIGWAALTMRDYSKLRSQGLHSAIPQWHYWRSLAGIINVPPNQLTKTHAIALKGLVDSYAHLFIKFYGQAAKVALHRAIVELPALAPESAGFDAVRVLRDTVGKKYQLTL
jgi:nucleoporin GLE1